MNTLFLPGKEEPYYQEGEDTTARFERLLKEAATEYNFSLTEIVLTEESLNLPDNFIVLTEGGLGAVKGKYDKLKAEIEKNQGKVISKKDIAKGLIWWTVAITIAAQFLPMGVTVLIAVATVLTKILDALEPDNDKEVKKLSSSLSELSKLKHKTNNPKLKKDLDKIEDDLGAAITAYKKKEKK